ncbi:MAG: hypothetical protein EA361_04580, partial [Bacteroidetes bacterium]
MKCLQKIYFLTWIGVLLVALASCTSSPEPATRNIFSVSATIEPPIAIKAGEPVIHHLSDNPTPEIIDLTTRPEPVKIPADFYITMQNFNTEHGLAMSSIIYGFRDKAGNLWFGTSGNGVSKYDGKRFTNYFSSHGLIHNMVRSIYEDRKGNIWFGTYGGVSIYNGIYFENLTTEHGLADNNVSRIHEDKNGHFWISTFNGLSRLNPNGNDAGIQRFTNYTTDDGLPGNSVESILEDSRGNLWFATANGL